MEKLDFFDMKGKTKFRTDVYKIIKKGNRRFAVALAPSGVEAWRILGK